MKPFSINVQWVDPGPIRGEELRATFAELRILSGATAMTQVVHYPSRTTRDSLFEPVYPLAEWIVANWWPLLNEGCGIGRQTNPEWKRRHNFIWASEGYALPDLELSRFDGRIKVEWRRRAAPNSRVEFTNQGTRFHPADEVEKELAAFVDSVVDRLQQSNVNGTFLETEWMALRSAQLNTAEAEFCRAAGTLGFDPFDMPEATAQQILDAAKQLDSPTYQDFLRIAEPVSFDAQLQWVLDGKNKLGQFSSSLGRGTVIPPGQIVSLSNDRPWSIGYRSAELLRQLTNYTPQKPPIDLDQMFKVSGIVDGSSVTAPNAPQGFDAFMGMDRHNAPAIYLAKRRPESRRFAFCRGAFHHLFLKDQFALISAANDDRQRCNRAFAAEVLAPAKLLRGRVSNQFILPEEVDELAADFQVSPWVIRYQIKNHKIAELAAVA